MRAGRFARFGNDGSWYLYTDDEGDGLGCWEKVPGADLRFARDLVHRELTIMLNAPERQAREALCLLRRIPIEPVSLNPDLADCP